MSEHVFNTEKDVLEFIKNTKNTKEQLIRLRDEFGIKMVYTPKECGLDTELFFIYLGDSYTERETYDIADIVNDSEINLDNHTPILCMRPEGVEVIAFDCSLL